MDQECRLFTGTVRENIALGQPLLDQELDRVLTQKKHKSRVWKQGQKGVLPVSQ